jgi:hypothetical protein
MFVWYWNATEPCFVRGFYCERFAFEFKYAVLRSTPRTSASFFVLNNHQTLLLNLLSANQKKNKLLLDFTNHVSDWRLDHGFV